MLELKGIHKIYQPSQEVTVRALNGIDLKIADKGFMFLLGPSGCGKSTLLNILGGLDNFTKGDFLVDGVSTKHYTDENWDDYRNKRAGFIFQDYNLIEEFNVYENVEFALDLQKITDKRAKIESALKKVGMLEKKDKKVFNLSGGEKQRVSIARAIVKEPLILLADEPTGNLDVENSKQIFELLKELSAERLVVSVTHDENFANTYADKIVYLRDGQIVRQESLTVAEAKQEGSNIQTKKPHVKSRSLSFSRVMKQSFINMWHTKWKMLSAVFLLIFSLALFGAGLSATRYDESKTLLSIYRDKGISNVVFAQKSASINDVRKPFDELGVKDVKTIFSQYGTDLQEVYATGKERMYYKSDVANIPVPLEENFGYMPRGYQVVPDAGYADESGLPNEAYLKTLDANLIEGRLPAKGAIDEVAISLYTANVMMYSKSFKELYGVVEAKDLIDKYIVADFNDYLDIKIVGILDTKFDSKYYGNEDGKVAAYNSKIERESYSFDNLFFVSPAFRVKTVNNGNAMYSYVSCPIKVPELFLDLNYSMKNERVFTLEAYRKLFDDPNFFIGNSLKNEGGKTSIILSRDMANKVCEYEFKVNNIVTDEAKKDHIDKKVRGGIWDIQIYVGNNSYLEEPIDYTRRNLKSANVVMINDGGTTATSKDKCYSVITDDPLFEGIKKEMSTNIISYSIKLPGADVEGGDREATNILRKVLARFDIMDGYAHDVKQAGDEASPMMLFGMLGSLLFCVFGVLMLVNFIIDNIKVNNYQIGVMRCLGVKRKDIIIMFLVESLIVALIAFMFACALFFPITMFMQRGDQSTYLVPISVFEWKVGDIFAMLGVGVAVALIATIFPILAKTKEKPINILRSLE